ncbi:hypothetical protein FACS1894178_6800 [Bacteroidia bacterium]|nr:hypothetical protein FACS1894178_6800 [Bacteroidia bacterium]
MKCNILKIWVFFCFAAILFACNPYEKLPDETLLTYISCNKTLDSLSQECLRIYYTFQDGDGNIGLNTKDTLPPFDIFPHNSNFYIYVLDKDNSGDFKVMMVDTTEIYYAYRIAPFDVPGALKGSLTLDITAFDFASVKALSKNKVIRFDAFMYDRNLVKSNIAVSDEISVEDGHE